MAVVTRPYSETSGTIAFASSVNRYAQDFYDLQNGNINSANLAASGVGNSNIEDSAVSENQLDDSAVSFSKTHESVYAAAVLAAEVFG